MDESTYGSAHGRTFPGRWDASTALALLVLGAVVILFITHGGFRLAAAGSIGVS